MKSLNEFRLCFHPQFFTEQFVTNRHSSSLAADTTTFLRLHVPRHAWEAVCWDNKSPPKCRLKKNNINMPLHCQGAYWYLCFRYKNNIPFPQGCQWTESHYWSHFQNRVTNTMTESPTIIQNLLNACLARRFISLSSCTFFLSSFLYTEAKCQACLTPSSDTSIPADNYQKESDALVCRGEFNLLWNKEFFTFQLTF